MAILRTPSGTIELRALPNSLRALALFMSLGAANVAAQERAMELFLFQSEGEASALTTDKTGANLPLRAEGWTAVGSLGNLSDKLGENELRRLHSDGYTILDKVEPKSTRVEDWRQFSPGTFHLTPAALKEVREVHKSLSRHMGGPSIVCFTWGPVGVKEKDSPNWRELGVRLTIGGFPERDVPAAAVDYVEGVPLLFLFDPKSLPSPRPTEIDYGATGFVFAK